MSTQTLSKAAERELAAKSTVDLESLPPIDPEVLTQAFVNFLDTAGTSTGRATHYNTRKEQEEAAKAIHQNLFSIDRGIYGAALLLKGTTDYTTILGIVNLLSNNYSDGRSVLPLEKETQLINHLVARLSNSSVPRMFKTFLELKKKRVNNKRTRTLILSAILNSPKLEFWSIKYRHKICKSLEHAWGTRRTGIVRRILTKNTHTAKETAILHDMIDKHIEGDDAASTYVYNCVSFVLGDTDNKELPLFKAYNEAKEDLSLGEKLPREVLEGIRSKYHPTVSPSKVLELTKRNLTSKEKMKVQRKAKERKVDVEFDPTKQDVVSLYVHALETGMTEEIENALKDKAASSAANIPVKFNRVGVLVDASNSSYGSDTQKYRPLAVTLATRDMLEAANEETIVEYTGGHEDNKGLVHPEGSTNLAKGLVKLVQQEPEAVFIITDGYENAPAGRVNEVVTTLKKMGKDLPIYQISPVMGAEASGVRTLCSAISTIPLNKPSAIALGMVKVMLETNLKHGIAGLFNMTLPLIESNK